MSEKQEGKHYVIHYQLLGQVMKYMQGRPYIEVADLIGRLIEVIEVQNRPPAPKLVEAQPTPEAPSA